jgi:hypothetical protein
VGWWGRGRIRFLIYWQFETETGGLSFTVNMYFLCFNALAVKLAAVVIPAS